MDKIEWSEEMSIGVEEIDDQHKHLFFLYNTLLDAVVEPNIRERRNRILKELMDYAYYHFKTEHEYMKKVGYPDVRKHDRMHRDFGDAIYQPFRASIDSGIVSNNQILTLLNEWIHHHILIEDQKIADYVKKVKNQPEKVSEKIGS